MRTHLCVLLFLLLSKVCFAVPEALLYTDENPILNSLLGQGSNISIGLKAGGDSVVTGREIDNTQVKFYDGASELGTLYSTGGQGAAEFANTSTILRLNGAFLYTYLVDTLLLNPADVTCIRVSIRIVELSNFYTTVAFPNSQCDSDRCTTSTDPKGIFENPFGFKSESCS